jgi:hypothetical protein
MNTQGGMRSPKQIVVAGKITSGSQPGQEVIRVWRLEAACVLVVKSLNRRLALSRCDLIYM